MTKELKYNKYKIVFRNEKQTPVELWATNILYHSDHITFTNLASRNINRINLYEVLFVEILSQNIPEELLQSILKREIL